MFFLLLVILFKLIVKRATKPIPKLCLRVRPCVLFPLGGSHVDLSRLAVPKGREEGLLCLSVCTCARTRPKNQHIYFVLRFVTTSLSAVSATTVVSSFCGGELGPTRISRTVPMRIPIRLTSTLTGALASLRQQRQALRR